MKQKNSAKEEMMSKYPLPLPAPTENAFSQTETSQMLKRDT